MKTFLIVISFLVLHAVPAFSICPDGGPEPCGKFGGGYGSGCPDGGPSPCGKYGGGGCPDGGPPPCGNYGRGLGGGSGSYGGSSSSSTPRAQSAIENIIVKKDGSRTSGTIIKSTPEMLILKTLEGKELHVLRKEIKLVVAKGGE